MALVLADRVKETSTTTGTGTYTLAGAVTGFESFGSIGNGNTTYYACTLGSDFEVGIGTYTASGTTLARTTILQSSNSDNAVDWGAGTKTLFCTQPAEKAVFLNASDNIELADNEKVILGTGGDLEIYHDGNHSYIQDTGTGILQIISDQVKLESTTGEVIARFIEDSNVILYEDNVERFRTTSTGVTITGNPYVIGDQLVFEGSTSNSHELFIQITDPTADRTITLPDVTGTVLTTGNSDTPTTTTSSSDADFVLVDDGGTMKKITPSNLGITSGGTTAAFATAMAMVL